MKGVLTGISLFVFILGLIMVIIWKIRNKPVKKALVLAGVSLVICITAANIPEQRLENKESAKKADNIEKTDNIERVENAEFITSDMWMEWLNDFSEECAFVQFIDSEGLEMIGDGIEAALEGDEDDAAQFAMEHIEYYQGLNRAALIDTHGRIIWKSERTGNGRVLTEVSEFRNGLAYFIFNGNEGEIYYIIDLEGNVSYTKECSEDFMILSHGGGLFLVAEHIINFDVDEWQIGTIDKNGNSVADYKTYEVTTLPEEPLSVEEPVYPYSELQEIDNALSQLAGERQAWVEECWDYDGDIDAEYDRMIGETEEDFVNRLNELTEQKTQLLEKYDEKLAEYQEYQMELELYNEASQHAPETLACDKYLMHDCEYFGDNIYRVPLGYGFVFLNMNSQSVLYVDTYSENKAYIEQFITKFENGSAIVLYNEPVDKETLREELYNEPVDRDCIERFITKFENGSDNVLYSEPVDWEVLREAYIDFYLTMLPTNLHSLCRMETDGTITPIVSNCWTKYVLPDILQGGNEFHDGLLFVPYDERKDVVYKDEEYYALTMDEEAALKKGFFFQTGVYYNIDGEVALELSEYNGKRKYFCYPFYNGYALMLIEGADRLTYFTVIDKKGELQFEPQLGFDDAYMSKDGKYLIAVKWHNLTVFDIMGNPLVSINSDQISPDNLNSRYDMCDGTIRLRNFYVNVKDGIIIGPEIDANVEFFEIGYQINN
ncbi:MAG: hypothetical protein K2K21_16940 [Lachnospiraceae bacterium]|nr:hypothetical protein [Lachnospiraceae bacterium]